MDSAYSYDAVIVGGGFAGTTVAAEMAAVAPPGYRALLIDAGAPGPGNGYAPASDRLYMNGSAASMSAVSGDRRHLVRWLATADEHALIPRRLFGRYVAERFHRAIERRPEFGVERARIVDLVPREFGFTVVDARGCERVARNVVLALGNFAPDDAFLPLAIRTHAGFAGDPWRFEPRGTAGDALLVGSGLTAMDAVALLDERGFEGRIHLVSRHGLLPAREDPLTGRVDARTLMLDAHSPYALLRTLRAAARRHVARGGDWRDVVESMRAHAPAIWASWSVRDRRRFLRHLQSFWAVHRYRTPPATAAVYDRLDAAGRIVRHRGRISAAERCGDSLRVCVSNAHGSTTIDVATVVNCTGPAGDYGRSRDPFVRSLVARGIVRPDPLRLGLDATAALEVVDRYGSPNPHLFALGPPLRGVLYETTAVPETREQAAQIARRLARRFAGADMSVAS